MTATVVGLRGAPERSYALPFDVMQRLVWELLSVHRPAGNPRFMCYRIADSSRFSDVARTVECTVFEEFFGNAPDMMTEAYAPYERASIFFLAVDCQAQEPAGTLRVIGHSPAGFKSLNDIQQPPLALPLPAVVEQHRIDDLSRCWDVGTLAVLKKYRGRATDHAVSTLLYGQFHAGACALGIDHAVTILDQHAYRQLTETFGIPFFPIAGTAPFDYLGSANSRAAYMYMPSVVPTVEAHMHGLSEEMRRVLRPQLMRIIHAEGLPEIVAIS